MNWLGKWAEKKRKQSARKEWHRMIVNDSKSVAPNPNAAHHFRDFSTTRFSRVQLRFYPIALNRNVNFTPYIQVVVDDSSKSFIPLSWDTIKFAKEHLSLDLEKIHQSTLDHFNSGISTQPFERCYTNAHLSWD